MIIPRLFLLVLACLRLFAFSNKLPTGFTNTFYDGSTDLFKRSLHDVRFWKRIAHMHVGR